MNIRKHITAKRLLFVSTMIMIGIGAGIVFSYWAGIKYNPAVTLVGLVFSTVTCITFVGSLMAVLIDREDRMKAKNM